MKFVTVTSGLLGHEGKYYSPGATVSLPDGKAEFAVRLGIARMSGKATLGDAPLTDMPAVRSGGRGHVKSDQPPG